MKILIAGLGLIGGSIAKALKRAGYAADGFDRRNVCGAAIKENVIEKEACGCAAYDLVLVALPPDAAIAFIGDNQFKDGAIVADICGVKGALERFVYAESRNFRYVGCHPMAGKEVSGFENSCEDLFDGASMIIAENGRTDKNAVRELEALFGKLGFSRIVRCSAEYHDKKIAYTSQLAHIVSNAYVKSETADGYAGFTGGSFQDIVGINKQGTGIRVHFCIGFECGIFIRETHDPAVCMGSHNRNIKELARKDIRGSYTSADHSGPCSV